MAPDRWMARQNGAIFCNAKCVRQPDEIYDRDRRLHIRYKTATWLRGLIPNPFMRSPMPKPKQAEIDALYRLLMALKFEVIEAKETKLAA